jgi:hypothetical protein
VLLSIAVKLFASNVGKIVGWSGKNYTEVC